MEYNFSDSPDLHRDSQSDDAESGLSHSDNTPQHVYLLKVLCYILLFHTVFMYFHHSRVLKIYWLKQFCKIS